MIAKFLHLGDKEPGLGSSGPAAMPALYPLRQGIIYPLSDWLLACLIGYRRLCQIIYVKHIIAYMQLASMQLSSMLF